MTKVRDYLRHCSCHHADHRRQGEVRAGSDLRWCISSAHVRYAWIPSFDPVFKLSEDRQDLVQCQHCIQWHAWWETSNAPDVRAALGRRPQGGQQSLQLEDQA